LCALCELTATVTGLVAHLQVSVPPAKFLTTFFFTPRLTAGWMVGPAMFRSPLLTPMTRLFLAEGDCLAVPPTDIWIGGQFVRWRRICGKPGRGEGVNAA
jgi:hypothetical protein